MFRDSSSRLLSTVTRSSSSVLSSSSTCLSASSSLFHQPQRGVKLSHALVKVNVENKKRRAGYLRIFKRTESRVAKISQKASYVEREKRPLAAILSNIDKAIHVLWFRVALQRQGKLKTVTRLTSTTRIIPSLDKHSTVLSTPFSGYYLTPRHIIQSLAQPENRSLEALEEVLLVLTDQTLYFNPLNDAERVALKKHASALLKEALNLYQIAEKEFAAVLKYKQESEAYNNALINKLPTPAQPVFPSLTLSPALRPQAMEWIRHKSNVQTAQKIAQFLEQEDSWFEKQEQTLIEQSQTASS